MSLVVRITAVIYLTMSVITFIVYGLDKRAAIKGRSRVPEATLHLLGLLGGFFGALVAQQVFRHKRRKLWFILITWLIVLLHAAGWFFLMRSR
ncbi:MAG: DUF1294 domain-containing protein [Phycisphaerales bacterium]|nr:MAG: DUF1294 domain-containing protein [Phycisphaerales bacterium]